MGKLIFILAAMFVWLSCRQPMTFKVLQFNIRQEGTVVEGGLKLLQISLEAATLIGTEGEITW